MLPILMTRAGSSSVPAASSSGRKARVRKNGDFRLRSTTLSQAAAGNPSSVAPQVAPALLTSTFRDFSRSPTCSARARHSCSVDRSAGSAVTVPYWLSSCCAAAQASALRELMYTRAPASSRPRAIMSPIPRLPPVTTAALPDRSNRFMISPLRLGRWDSAQATRYAWHHREVNQARQLDLVRGRAGSHQRVTNVELFFDLVYVFAVTQLSQYLLAHRTIAGVLHAALLLT